MATGMTALKMMPHISMVLRVAVTSISFVCTRSVKTETLLPSLPVRYRVRSVTKEPSLKALLIKVSRNT